MNEEKKNKFCIFKLLAAVPRIHKNMMEQNRKKEFTATFSFIMC